MIEPHGIPILYQMGMEGRHPSLTHLDEIKSSGTTEQANPSGTASIKLTIHQHPDHDTTDWVPFTSTAS